MDHCSVDINEDAVCVLKIDEKGFFYKDFVIIDKSLLSILNVESLYNLLRTNEENLEDDNLFALRKQTAIEFYLELYKSHKELFVFRDYSPRTCLKSSYIHFDFITSIDDITIDYFFHIDNTLRIRTEEKSPLRSFIDYTSDFLHSFLIENTYKLCSEDKNIKVFSHRRVGWTRYKYLLNDILSVEVSTNFSYGSASYFVVTLLYEDIQIIPYSRLVLYRYANAVQLLRHTREYDVADRSWEYAIDFLHEACNDLLTIGKESFIAKYFITECDKISELLPKYLITDEFKLSENKYGNDNNSQVKLEGYQLIIFRGEKVAGAIEFYNSIKQLSKLFPVNKYLECILKCSNDIIPQLNEACDNLDNDLQLKNNLLDMAKEVLSKKQTGYDVCKERKEKCEEYRFDLRDKVFEKIKELPEVDSKYSPLVKDQVEAQFDKMYPDWKEILKKYDISSKELYDQTMSYKKLLNDYNTHIAYQKSINDYKTKIETFKVERQNN